MDDHKTRGTTHAAELVRDVSPAVFDPHQPAAHQERPSVVAFDPYFTNQASGSRDFDELMWERAA
jgi:hypothetical protein